MHRNTATTIAGLSVIAALLFGINVGRKLPKFGNQAPVQQVAAPTEEPVAQATPTPTTAPVAQAIPQTLGANIEVKPYTNGGCGYTTSIPATWQFTEHTLLTTTLSNTADVNEQITIICQVDIPRPPVQPNLVEKTTLGGITAELYHDTNPADGSPFQAVFANVPGTDYDIIVSGSGAVLNHVLATFEFTSDQETTAPIAVPDQPIIDPSTLE